MGFFDKIISFFNAGDEHEPARDISRNDSCWCGSGKKYKKCHLHEDEEKYRKKCASNCSTT